LAISRRAAHGDRTTIALALSVPMALRYNSKKEVRTKGGYGSAVDEG
jgi:hypothetical protein